jgi:hypothetical protein
VAAAAAQRNRGRASAGARRAPTTALCEKLSYGPALAETGGAQQQRAACEHAVGPGKGRSRGKRAEAHPRWRWPRWPLPLPWPAAGAARRPPESTGIQRGARGLPGPSAGGQSGCLT